MPDDLNLSLIMKADASGLKAGTQTAASEMRKLAGAVEQGEQAVAASTDRGTAAINRQQAAMGRARVGAVNFRSAISAVGFQAQDMAIQLAAGVRPLTVLGVQGGQLASAFGPVGVAIGTAITLTGVLGGALLGASDDTEELSDAQDLLSGTLAGGAKSAAELRVEYAELGAEAQQLQRVLLRGAADAANRKIDEARIKVRELADEMERALLVSEQNVEGSLPILGELLRVRQGATDAGAAIVELTQSTAGLTEEVQPLARSLIEELRAIDDQAKIAARSEASLAVIQGDATREQIALLQDKATAAREVGKAERDAAREAAREAAEAQKRRRALAMSFQETSSWLDRQREATQAYDVALREATRRGNHWRAD